MEVSKFKGLRMHNFVTFNPSIKRPGEKIYVRVPKPSPSSCIKPNTMYLVFKFKNSNTKSRFLNNLSRLLVEQLQVQIDSTVVYDNTGESTIEWHKDKWLPDSVRNTMKRYGIASLNVRKLMSGDDSGSNSATTNGVNDKLIADRYTNLYIRLGKILNDHGLFAPIGINYDITYTITLLEASRIMEAQSSQSVDTYTLEGMRLEYQTITNEELARSVLDTYIGGRSLTYEDSFLQTSPTWFKDHTDAEVNLRITNYEKMVKIYCHVV